jgi:hypothetical protein
MTNNTVLFLVFGAITLIILGISIPVIVHERLETNYDKCLDSCNLQIKTGYEYSTANEQLIEYLDMCKDKHINILKTKRLF